MHMRTHARAHTQRTYRAHTSQTLWPLGSALTPKMANLCHRAQLHRHSPFLIVPVMCSRAWSVGSGGRLRPQYPPVQPPCFDDQRPLLPDSRSERLHVVGTRRRMVAARATAVHRRRQVAWCHGMAAIVAATIVAAAIVAAAMVATAIVAAAMVARLR